MDIRPYIRLLEEAKADLEAAMEQREEIEKKISSLKQTIIALSRVCEKATNALGLDMVEFEGSGITDQCREVLRTSGRDMTPVEVRDQLGRMGIDRAKYTNLLASVHRILKRLVESKEIVRVNREDGETAYRWIRRFPRYRTYKRRRVSSVEASAPKERE